MNEDDIVWVSCVIIIIIIALMIYFHKVNIITKWQKIAVTILGEIDFDLIVTESNKSHVNIKCSEHNEVLSATIYLNTIGFDDNTIMKVLIHECSHILNPISDHHDTGFITTNEELLLLASKIYPWFRMLKPIDTNYPCFE